MEARQSDQTDHDEMASDHRMGHPVACRRGRVEPAGSDLYHGISPTLPCAFSHSGPLEVEGENAQMDDQSMGHGMAASSGPRNGHGSDSDQALLGEKNVHALSYEGSRVPRGAPSLCDASSQGIQTPFVVHL